jgi:hypothetical protein
MKEKIEKINRYLNPVAQLHLISSAPYKTWVAGRGCSKSFTNGLKQAKKMALMPRSCGLFNSPTYTMIYTKTLIPMKAAWEQHLGYHEGLHYVVGKAPPKHFDKPWHKPHRYENVVTWWNGRTIIFGSFDRAALISGGSYDDCDTDEAYMIDKEDYDNFVIPTMRGTHPSFKDIDIHLQQSFTSSMAFKGQGDWLLDYRLKSLQNPKMYSFIGWEPNVKVQMGSTWMNRKVLGDKAILQMKAEMDDISYRIMILNEQVTNFGNTFYPALSPKHFYIPKANDKVIAIPLDQLTFVRDASYDIGPDDYNPDMPIHISHDFGKFNCITIDQEYPKEIRFINTMHTFNGGKEPKDLDDLADMFAEYYRMHRTRILYQWGDKSGKNTLANSKLNHFEQFAERLRKKDWRVIMKKTGDIEHLERHRFITKLHKEEDARLPKVRHNAKCTDLKISLESAPMDGDKKDKSSEINASIKPQHATHYSDAYDYRLYHGLRQREKGDDGYNPYGTSLTM